MKQRRNFLFFVIIALILTPVFYFLNPAQAADSVTFIESFSTSDGNWMCNYDWDTSSASLKLPSGTPVSVDQSAAGISNLDDQTGAENPASGANFYYTHALEYLEYLHEELS